MRRVVTAAVGARGAGTPPAWTAWRTLTHRTPFHHRLSSTNNKNSIPGMRRLAHTSHVHPSDIFRDTPSRKLLFDSVLLTLLRIPQAAETGLALMNVPLVGGAMRSIVRISFFRRFCAGESVQETLTTVHDLYAKGIFSILNYAVEGGVDHPVEATSTLCHVIDVGRDEPGVSFACLKMTSTCSGTLLQKICRLIGEQPDVEEVEQLLEGEEQTQFQEFLKHLHMICDKANECNTPLLLDAEQSTMQPAINYLALRLSRQYNKERPAIFNTYQMYLRGSRARLERDIERARMEGFHLGVKLVRGAYLVQERQFAQEQGKTSPIHATIERTHRSYDDGVKLCLDNLGTVAVMIATHNQASLFRAKAYVHKLRIEPNNPNVSFAQLMGMADHLSLTMAKSGHTVAKYLPFGPMGKVLPYLTRRIQENRDMLSATRGEQQIIWGELRRRILCTQRTA